MKTDQIEDTIANLVPGSSRESFHRIMEEEQEYEEKSFSSCDESKKKLFLNLDVDQKLGGVLGADLKESIYSSRESISNRESLRLPQTEQKKTKKQTVSVDFENGLSSKSREKTSRYMSEEILQYTFERNGSSEDKQGLFMKKISSNQEDDLFVSKKDDSTIENEIKISNTKIEKIKDVKKDAKQMIENKMVLEITNQNKTEKKNPQKVFTYNTQDSNSDLGRLNIKQNNQDPVGESEFFDKKINESDDFSSKSNSKEINILNEIKKICQSKENNFETPQINNINVFNNVGNSIINFGDKRSNKNKNKSNRNFNINLNFEKNPVQNSLIPNQIFTEKTQPTQDSNKMTGQNKMRLSKNSENYYSSELMTNNIENLPFQTSENTTNLMSDTNSDSIFSSSIQMQETNMSGFNNDTPKDESKRASLKHQKKAGSKKAGKQKNSKFRKKMERHAISFFVNKNESQEGDSLVINNIKQRISNNKSRKKKFAFSKTFLNKKGLFNRLVTSPDYSKNKTFEKIKRPREKLSSFLKYKPHQNLNKTMMSKLKEKKSRVSERTVTKLFQSKRSIPNNLTACLVSSSNKTIGKNSEKSNKYRLKNLTKVKKLETKQSNFPKLNYYKAKRWRSPNKQPESDFMNLIAMKSAPHEKKLKERVFDSKLLKTCNDDVKDPELHKLQNPDLAIRRNSYNFEVNKWGSKQSDSLKIQLFNDYGIKKESQKRTLSSEILKASKRRFQSTLSSPSGGSFKVNFSQSQLRKIKRKHEI